MTSKRHLDSRCPTDGRSPAAARHSTATGLIATTGWPEPGLVHHSDRGGQYLSVSYQHLLDAHGALCSISRPGNCLDNAVAESFFHTLKTELVYQQFCRTREEARRAIFEYVEGFYDRPRLHSTLDYRSPEEYERSVA